MALKSDHASLVAQKRLYMDIITELNIHHHSNHVLDALLAVLRAYGTTQCTETPATQSKLYSIPQKNPINIQGCGFQRKTTGMSEAWDMDCPMTQSSDLFPKSGMEVFDFRPATSSADLDLNTGNMQTMSCPLDWAADLPGQTMTSHSCTTSISPGHLSAKSSSWESSPQNFMSVVPQVFSVPIQEYEPSNVESGACPTTSEVIAPRNSKATPPHGIPGTHVCIPPPCRQQWRSSRIVDNSCTLRQQSVGSSNPPEVVNMPPLNPYHNTSSTSTETSTEFATRSSATKEKAS